MENLTRSLRIAYNAPDCNPVPDHDLVIFKKVGAGLEFRELVPTGSKFQKKFLERADFVSFAVSRDENLRHTFSYPDKHSDQIHTYILRFTIDFKVSDQRRLVEKLDRDPVKRLQQETEEVLGGTARQLDWAILSSESAEFERQLLDHETAAGSIIVSNLERLRRTAQDMGIALRSVNVRRSLTERETRVSGKIRDLQEEAVIGSVENDLKRLQQQWSANTQISNEVTQLTIESMRRWAKDPHLSTEIHQNIRELSLLQGEARNTINPSAPQLMAPGGSRLLATAGNGLAVDLAAKVLELMTTIGSVSSDERRLGSSMLHLVAELSLATEAEDEVLERYSSDLEATLQRVYKRLHSPQIELIDQLREPLQLKARICQEMQG